MSLLPFRLRQGAAFLDQPPPPTSQPPVGSLPGLLRAAADEIERLHRIAAQRKNKKEIAVTARNRATDGLEYWRGQVEGLRDTLRVAHGALICIGTPYAKEVADYVGRVLDPNAYGEKEDGTA